MKTVLVSIKIKALIKTILLERGPDESKMPLDLSAED